METNTAIDVADDEFIDEDTAAPILHLPVSTLQRWRVEGKGPEYFKFGKVVRYGVKSLRRYILESRRRSTSEAA
jgi:hypothetical protein